MKYYQQGDVLLKKISKLPEGLTKLDTNVVQFGETTGHKHQFLQYAAIDLYTKGGISSGTITDNEHKFLVVKEQTALTHEEHKPINVPPGIYEIDIVREYDYEKDEMTRVVD